MYYHVSLTFKRRHYLKYSPKCRWDMSDNFQFPFKCTTIYNICRRSPSCSSPPCLHLSDGSAVIFPQRSASSTLQTSLLLTASCTFSPVWFPASSQIQLYSTAESFLTSCTKLTSPSVLIEKVWKLISPQTNNIHSCLIQDMTQHLFM